MGAIFEISRTGLTAITLHPLRSLVTIGALVAVLLPYLTCLGLSQGIRDQAEVSVRIGADLYVTARKFGRPVPISQSMIGAIKRVPGVEEVVPRIVGGIVLGKEKESAVLVGMPRERWPDSISLVDGALPAKSALNELVIGTELARRLSLGIGSIIPPFYHNTEGEKLSRVVGVFKGDVGIWQANLIFASLETAEHIFNQKGAATDLLVFCRSGYEDGVASAFVKLSDSGELGLSGQSVHVTKRSEVENLFQSNLGHREGVFQLHFVLMIVIGTLVILVTSGFGLPDRRREIGILKATGWQTDEILLRCAVESLLLAMAGISLSISLAMIWLAGLNGYGIASIFLTGVDAWPGFRVPYRLLPVPVLLTGVIGFMVVLTGTLYASWRSAITPPVEAMK